MNVQKILFPTDFSHSGDEALKYASSLAAESKALLYIVHVDDSSVTYVPGNAGYGISVDPIQEREKNQREQLAGVKPTVAGVDYQYRFLIGNAEKEILAFANQEKVDLIVMGSHGRTGLTRVLMGSIAEGVVRHAECPVLTVKQPAGQTHKTIVAKADSHYRD